MPAFRLSDVSIFALAYILATSSRKATVISWAKASTSPHDWKASPSPALSVYLKMPIGKSRRGLICGQRSWQPPNSRIFADPIRVYSLEVGAADARQSLRSPPPTEPDKPSARLALPDKPSIAVLPFQNMSGDSEQEYFSDGITEDIITALSRLRWFFVIARNSTFAYKGKGIDIKRLGQELGVRYVLEGSVRKSGQRVRITGQLIDATTGNHIWAERYDRELSRYLRSSG